MSDKPILFSAPHPEFERFKSRVFVAGNGCWERTGSKNAKGYGRYMTGKMAHRVALQIAGISIPVGMEVDHLCRNRICVNPAHLEVVTHRVNLMRGNTITRAEAEKTKCVAGHQFAGNNLVIRNGKRRCRECDRLRQFSTYQPTTSRRRRQHLMKAEVADIRLRISSGHSHSRIASDLGLSICTISRVRNREEDYGR